MSWKKLLDSRWLHPILLLVWVAIGAVLRFVYLDLKPLWTDEFATIVFSLGHSFRTVPLNQAISAEALLQPLQSDSQGSIRAVVQHLMTESTHPPAYFVLAHLWMQLFPAEGLVSMSVVRSLSVLFGVSSIPAVFGLGWLAFRSRLVGQLAAAMMAVSPFGIFLAQEARHYTLATLWVIASLCCLIVAVRSIRGAKSLPLWVGLTWVVVNSLGMATHYFFVLTLFAEALVLLGFWIADFRVGQRDQFKFKLLKRWQAIYAIAAGTAMGVLVWLPAWRSVYGNNLTQWIYSDGRSGLTWLDPILQAVVAWISMLVLTPVQAEEQWVVIVSALSLLACVLWAMPVIWRGLHQQWLQVENVLPIQVLGGFVLGAIAIFFGMTYGLGTNLTSAFRFNFVYFPAVVVLLAASLAYFWQSSDSKNQKSGIAQFGMMLNPLRATGKQVIVWIGLMGLVGSLSVAGDLAYQKTHRPDVVAERILKQTQAPALIAIAHQTHGQTGRLMGIAWELKRRQASDNAEILANASFLLAHQDQQPLSAAIALEQTLSQQPRPLDLWLVNFPDSDEIPDFASRLASQNCAADSDSWKRTDGYKYRLYRCPASNG